MILGGGVSNNANTPAINSQALTAQLPPPGYPNRWVLDKEAKILYVDNGTALVPIFVNFNGTGFVPYSGAIHDVDLVSTGHGLYAQFAEIGHDVGDGADVYAVVMYNNDPTGKGLLIQAPTPLSVDGTAIEIQDNTGSLTKYIAMYSDGHATFLLNVAAKYFSITGNAGGFSQNIVSDPDTAANADYILPYTPGGDSIALLSQLLLLVPYSGATTNVDLGAFDITATRLQVQDATTNKIGSIAVTANTLGADRIYTMPNYSGRLALNATLFQNLRQGLVGNDSVSFAFIASNSTSPSVSGVNVLCVYIPINITTVTTPMSFSVLISYTSTGGVAASFTVATGLVTVPGPSVQLTASRVFPAVTGLVTLALTLTAGSGTYDWMPTVQYVG